MAADNKDKEIKVIFDRDYTYSVKGKEVKAQKGDSASFKPAIANKLLHNKICKEGASNSSKK